MSWKKNAISYIVWGLYLVSVLPLFVRTGMYAAERIGIDNSYAGAGLSLLFALAVLGGFLSVRFWVLGRKNSGGSGISWTVVQKIAIVGLLAAGALVRVSCFLYAGEEAAYYDAAMVAQGAAIPQVAHGSVYIYLQLLRLLFMVAGNKWMAGIYLQVVLQLAACVLLYLAVSRLAGVFPALLMSAFLMLSPQQILQGLAYSPKMLYLCFYGAGLLCIAAFLKRSAQGKMNSFYDVLLLLFSGALTAFVCYLDITGVTLLVFAVTVCWVRKKKNRNIWGNSWLGIAVLTGAAAGFFCIYLLLDAYASGKSFAGVLRAWQALYQALGYDAYFWMRRSGDYLIYLMLFALMLVGAVSFWYRKKGEKLSPWILAIASLCLLEYLHMTTQEVSGFLLIDWMCAVLAGIGAQGMFFREKAPAGTAPQEPPSFLPEDTGDLVVLDENIQQAPEIRYIENPLPLPKKHVKKVMDYGFDPRQQLMDYDVLVDENDDFDIR